MTGAAVAQDLQVCARFRCSLWLQLGVKGSVQGVESVWYAQEAKREGAEGTLCMV